MFEFNNEYILKSMLASVHDEGSRIVSLGLASAEDVNQLIDPALHTAIKRATDGVHNQSVIVNTLADLHKNLSSVFFPGDFEKIASEEQEQLKQLLELQQEDTEPMQEEQELESDEVWEEEPTDLLDDQSIEEEYAVDAVCATLKNISYMLGKTGNHEAAYLVERRLQEIKSLAGMEDMFSEMQQMEKNPPRNLGPQQRMQQNWEAKKQQQQQQPKQQPQSQFQQLWQSQQQAQQPQQQPQQPQQQQQQPKQQPQQQQQQPKQQPQQQQQPKQQPQQPQQQQQPQPKQQPQQQQQQPKQQPRQKSQRAGQEAMGAAGQMWRDVVRNPKAGRLRRLGRSGLAQMIQNEMTRSKVDANTAAQNLRRRWKI